MGAEIRILFALGLLTSTAVWGWLTPRRRMPNRTVCYGQWGCFSLSAPFTNTAHLPQAPDLLGVQFFLHTGHQQPRARTRLDLDWSDQRLGEVVDVTKDTRVILHGYRDNGERPWVQNMVEALLEKADQNVLVVDWQRGARSVNYLQVVANTRLVGKMMAAMLGKLVRAGARPSSFHLIGASLGAHVAGYAGSNLQGIGRITGLDPAGPGFENTSPAVRLDPIDAIFVDVIHTNAVPLSEMGLGYVRPCGTVDFYPNGGRYQPGCRTSLLDQLLGVLAGEDYRRAMGCSHLRAIDFFTESINSQCAMVASPCAFPDVLNRFEHCPSSHWASVQGQCQDCVTMGYDVNLNASGVFYTRTRPVSPFCPTL